MLRLIFKTVYHNEDLAIHQENYRTLDIENKQIEDILNSGGSGGSGYERTNFIGIEIIKDTK